MGREFPHASRDDNVARAIGGDGSGGGAGVTGKPLLVAGGRDLQHQRSSGARSEVLADHDRAARAVDDEAPHIHALVGAGAEGFRPRHGERAVEARDEHGVEGAGDDNPAER